MTDITARGRGWIHGAGARAARGLIFFIQLYRHMVSPLRLPSCRFTPTCSQYAVDALTEYGLVRGSWLAAIRLGKCGPWHSGGWDPIPERRIAPAPGGDAWGTPAELEEWGIPATRGEDSVDL